MGDTLDYSAYTGNVTVNLATGQATGTSGISNIEIIKGGTGINTITGDDGDNTLYGGPSNDRLVGGKGNDTYVLYDGWGTDEIVELPGEGDDTVDLSGITGATGQLTFNFGAGTLTITGGGNALTHTGGNVENFVGGDFSNNFVFGAGVTIAGGAAGGSGGDTLDFSAYTTAVNAILTRLGSADGFAGTLNGMAFDNINALTGGSASDRLTGMNATATFTIQPAIVEYVSTNTLIAANFETLTGGTNSDTFALANTVTFAGTINGGAGTDTLDYSAYTTAITVDLSSRVAQHIGALSSIENVTGGSVNDVLTGDAGPNVLRGGPGNDLLSGLGGNDILVGGADNDTLIGGAGNDTFRFELNAFGVDGIIELGAEGYDAMDFSALSDNLNIVLGSVTVTNGANTATHSGTFIEKVIGGSGNDLFTATGNQSVDLDGGPGDDTFIFNDDARLTGTLSGAAGSDTLNFASYATGRDFVLTGLGASGGFNGTATGITGSFTNINTLVGSAASTTDTLTGLNAASTFNLQPANTQYISTNTLAFSGVETMQGGSGSDTFNIGGTQTFDLLGGAGEDTFVFADNGRLLGRINGQTGSDTLDFTAFTTARRIVLTGLGSTNGFAGGDYTPLRALTGGFDNFNTLKGSSDPAGGDILIGLNVPGEWVCGTVCTYTANPILTFTGFETLVGGDANDTFTINGVRDLTLIGGAGNDTFILPAGAEVLGSINGQGGNDTLEYGLTILPSHNAGMGTATGVRGGIFSIENFTLTVFSLPVVPPIIVVQVSASGTESTQSVPGLSLLVVRVYTLVTVLRSGEPVWLHPQFINILVVNPSAQVMLSAGSGAVADIITGTVASLPFALPSGYQFVASLNVAIFDENGATLKKLPPGSWMNLSFVLPDNYASQTFMLLYWDETLNDGMGAWVELPIQILFGDAASNENLTEIVTYYRYWDASANAGLGEWLTITASGKFWDALFGDTLGGWFESSVAADETIQPAAVLAGQSNFTGTFVLVAIDTDN